MSTDGYALKGTRGNVFAGENEYVYVPRKPNGLRGVVLCHGAGKTGLEWADTTVDAGSTAIAAALARAGFYCIAGDYGMGTWGNATGTSRIDAAFTYLSSAYGVPSDKALLLGVSMGNQNALQYAIAHPTKVAALVGIIPVSSITDIYNNDRGSNRGGIQNAWGVAYPTALPAGADTSLNNNWVPAIGIPYKMYYSTADTTIIPSTVTDLAGKVGATATIISTTLDHSDAAVAQAPIAEIIAHFRAHG